ncbi:type II toxin-antitoxin system VapC family toxin [Methyloceanibacter sp.]|uniref:type II toxin-antitoxin system VapC family toxin n=1 Tax=Methyloceanibacter sp. TaxID=1965321 RepID=UPI003D6CE859
MRIYLDTNVFVTAVEHTGELSELAKAVIEAGKIHPGLLVTSELTLAELLVKPFQLARDGIVLPRDTENPIMLTPGTVAAIYADLVEQRPGLDVIAVDRSILILAAFHRAEEPRTKLPDAIHLATAEQSACTVVVTGDRKLKPSAQHVFERVDLKIADLKRLLDEVASR